MLLLVVLAACDISNPFGSAPSPPALPGSAMDVNECQPFTSLPCPDQSIQVKVQLGRTGLQLVYRSDRVPGRTAAPTADVKSQGLGGWTLSVVHSYDTKAQLLLLGDGGRRHVASLSIQSGAYSGKVAIASEDGRQVYVFDSSGRHQATLDAISGAALLKLDHDSAGRLTGLRDRSGSAIGVNRDAKGVLASFTLPGGALIPVTVDGDGFIALIQQPGGATDSFTYARAGLMTSHTMPVGAAAFFTYDASGLLASVTQPGGATQALTRSAITGGYSINLRSSSGRSSTYTVSRAADTITRTVEDGGGKSEEVISAGGTRQLTLANGDHVTTELGADPRFGMQDPVLRKQTVKSPKGLTQVLTEQRQATFSGDPLSGVQLTDTIRVDGQAFSTSYDPKNRTVTASNPGGVRSTFVLDAAGRVQRSVQAGVTSQYTYDGRGRITAVATGSGGQQRIGKVDYDDTTGTVTVTDPVGKVSVITSDAAGNPALLALAGGGHASLVYDAAGRLVDVLSPGGGNHVLNYSDRGLLTSEWSAGGAFGTTLAYDDDGLTSSVGGAVQRDPGGRLTSVKTIGGVLSATFAPGSDVPTLLKGPGGVQLSRTLDGGLITDEAWTGPVAGEVALTLDGQGRVVATNARDTTIATEYDSSGRPSRIGDLTLGYDPASGVISKQALASLTTTITRDSFGQITSTVTTSGSSSVFEQRFVHDPDGRIVQIDETMRGKTASITFAYDADGRLVSETSAGSSRTYTYSADGNLLSASNLKFVYDAAGRLMRAGSTTFTYSAGGSLASRKGPEGTTRYTYDERGVLVSVVLPGGKRIDYVTDAIGRRIGKRVNGALVDGMLWSGNVPVAQLDGSGAVFSRFVYDADGRLAEVLHGGKSYRVLTDPNGSVRLVVDATDGTIAQRIDYDAYGNAIANTNPGFQPFGFGGGVFDRVFLIDDETEQLSGASRGGFVAGLKLLAGQLDQLR